MVIYAAISAVRKLLQKVYQESETSLCPTVWDAVSKRNKSFFPSNFDGLEVHPGALRTQASTPQLDTIPAPSVNFPEPQFPRVYKTGDLVNRQNKGQPACAVSMCGQHVLNTRHCDSKPKALPHTSCSKDVELGTASSQLPPPQVPYQ